MSFIQALTGSNIRSYVKGTELRPMWGETDRDIISTDDTMQYMLNLLTEKSQQIGKQYALTTSLTTHTEIENSIEEASNTLVKAYSDIIKDNPNVEGIYTVLNVGAPNSPSHQNWLFYSPQTGQLLRFEPNEDYNELFKTGDLCRIIVDKLNEKNPQVSARYEIAKGRGINTFSGCRALSTLLASLHVKGIQFESLMAIGKKNIKPFTYLMQTEMKECPKQNFPRSTRKERFPVVIVG